MTSQEAKMTFGLMTVLVLMSGLVFVAMNAKAVRLTMKKNIQWMCACFVIASLVLPAGAIPDMNDEEMMMAFMGVGLENPLDGALAAGLLSVDDPPVDFPNASATRAMSINAAGDIV